LKIQYRLIYNLIVKGRFNKMDRDWHKRLKESREKAGLTLKEVSGMDVFDVSQQSLIKYESGEVFPRIDLLDKMCKKYNVTIDYILYGSSELSKTNDLEGQLVSLFMLMHSGKIQFGKKEKVLFVQDKKLEQDLMILDIFLENNEIATIDDLSALIRAIKKMSEEKDAG